VKVESVPIATLSQDPANARKHDDKNLESIKASLRRFGQQKPIVVDSSNVVRAGNGTLAAATALGWDSINVVQTDLQGSEATAYAIADNRTAELAEWDDSVLAASLSSLADVDETWLSDLQFSEKELAELVASTQEQEIIEDEVPDLTTDPVTQTGDLWILGEHRLLCGDSTDASDIAKLMNGKTAEMMFTDPPYGVNYEGGHFHSGDVNIKRKREKLSDDNSTEIYSRFLPVALSVVNGPCYLWFADSRARDVYNAVFEAGGEVHALIIWHKINATYAAMNAQYKQRHEPCLYFKPKDSTLRWSGSTTEATVWSKERDSINEFHPTQKPISLAAKAIKNHAAKLILDCFLGSGSTLIAAEQLDRKCYGMEISRQYCDVIVERWEKLTGKKARLEGDGSTS